MENMTMEESFQEMEHILGQLESKEVTLEESFQLYKQGMEYLKHCNDLIDQVEKQVKMLSDNGELEEFEEV
ncbi:MAG: exodeoxyribonuclease VII small subunit [Lachnospiraceae bacterium]|nr:exodeoxyribonuclease VII small subunit [Lachnospiraceae bacterium]MDD6192781.1 exodeoxyribonuclease VII small subunit [Lachnospiraceae bacterium]MDY4793582.1 exodeoxyribonuclease VII small subunit [Pararoseburia sp.]